MIQFYFEGGAFMHFILAASVVAIAVIVQKVLQLRVYKPKETFFRDIIEHVRKGDVPAAKLLCSGTSHPLAKVIAIVLNNHSYAKEVMESEVNKEVMKLTPRIMKNSNYLFMTGNVATLLGLLGTIQGLIMSFSSLQSASAASKAELLANGISTAMNTTAFGLVVAIPCVIAYTIITTQENDILQKYNETLTEIIHILDFEVLKK